MVSVIQFPRALTLLGSANVGGLIWVGGHSLRGLKCWPGHLIIVSSWTLSCSSSLCLPFLIGEVGPTGTVMSACLVGSLEDKWETECELLDIIPDLRVAPCIGLLAKPKCPTSILHFALSPRPDNVSFFFNWTTTKQLFLSYSWKAYSVGCKDVFLLTLALRD